MCGISGVIVRNPNHKYFDLLKVSDIRGQDGTGICILRDEEFITKRWDCRAQAITDFPELKVGDFVIGQNRLAIFGLGHENDQPLLSEDTAIVHNGQLYHFDEAFAQQPDLKRELRVDTELLLRMLDQSTTGYTLVMPEGIYLADAVAEAFNDVMCHDLVKGNAACLILRKGGQFITAASFDKPLWAISVEGNTYFFSTERIGIRTFGEELVKAKAIELALREIKTVFL